MLTIILASSANADGLSTKLAEGASTAASTTVGTAATSGGLFGGGIFGKPANSSAATPLAANKDAAPLGMVAFFISISSIFMCHV